MVPLPTWKVAPVATVMLSNLVKAILPPPTPPSTETEVPAATVSFRVVVNI